MLRNIAISMQLFHVEWSIPKLDGLYYRNPKSHKHCLRKECVT